MKKLRIILLLVFGNWLGGVRRKHETEKTAHLHEAELLAERLRQKDRVIAMLRGHIMDKSEILDMLEETDPVTLYVFLTEADRKKQRLIEAMAAAQDKSHEIDKALRLWTVQVAQYADNTVFNARMQAFRDAGIERVRWITQHDERVCKKCDKLDGHIFRIEDVPPPQHWGCRCILRVVD